jgi:chromosome segregation ATPase
MLEVAENASKAMAERDDLKERLASALADLTAMSALFGAAGTKLADAEQRLTLRCKCEFRNVDVPVNECRYHLGTAEQLTDAEQRLETANREMKASTESLVRKVGDAEQQTEEVEKNARMYELECSDANHRAKEAERERDALKTYRNRTVELERERDELRALYNVPGGVLESAEARIQRLQSQATDLTIERGKLRERVAELERERDELKGKLASACEKVVYFEHQATQYAGHNARRDCV